MHKQLDLFEEEKSEIEYLKEHLAEVRESGDKVRRGMYAKHSELARKFMELQERMQIIERNICRGK